jgi:hypothetical protein
LGGELSDPVGGVTAAMAPRGGAAAFAAEVATVETGYGPVGTGRSPSPAASAPTMVRAPSTWRRARVVSPTRTQNRSRPAWGRIRQVQLDQLVEAHRVRVIDQPQPGVVDERRELVRTDRATHPDNDIDNRNHCQRCDQPVTINDHTEVATTRFDLDQTTLELHSAGRAGTAPQRRVNSSPDQVARRAATAQQP